MFVVVVAVIVIVTTAATVIIIIIVITIIVVSVIIVIITNNFLNTDFVYNKVVQYNLGFLHYCHVYNTKKIFYTSCSSVSDVCLPNFTFTSSSDLLVTAVKPNLE
jgi:hypothetical protein